MLKVLHCIYDDPRNPWVGGGGAVRMFELYRRLTGEVEATVLTGNYPGAQEGFQAGVRYVRLGATRPYVWSRLTYGRLASQWLRDGAYDAAVFDYSVYTPILLPRDRPIGITVHHVTGPSAVARWGRLVGTGVAAFEKRMLARATCFSATSIATEAALCLIAPRAAQIFRVGAGVPDELFDVRRREEEYVLYYGRLDWFQKGLDVLLETTRQLAAENPGLRLRVAGRGRDGAKVEAAARRLGIQEHVTVVGTVTEAERKRLFAGAKLLLMPSRFEGFGMVAAEAMASGVPIVAAASGSLPEVIDPPAGGVLVPPEDAAALATAAANLLKDERTRAELSSSARQSAERFRWSTVAKHHLEFVQAIAFGTVAIHPTKD